MKTAIIVLALGGLLSISAHARTDCRDKAIEVELDTSTAAPFDLQTEIADRCIGAETLVILHAVAPIGASWRYWQDFPNSVHGRAVINHPVVAPGFNRFLATFKNVEAD